MPKLTPKKKTTHKSTWKKFETAVAKVFGSERTPLSGGNSKITRSDSLHGEIFIECKYRAKSPTFDLWTSTKERADKEDKIPLVAIKKKGGKGFLFVISPDDLDKLAELKVRDNERIRRGSNSSESE